MDNINQNIAKNIDQNIGQNIDNNSSQNVDKNIGQNIDHNSSQNVDKNIGQNIDQSTAQNKDHNIAKNIDHNIGQNNEEKKKSDQEATSSTSTMLISEAGGPHEQNLEQKPLNARQIKARPNSAKRRLKRLIRKNHRLTEALFLRRQRAKMTKALPKLLPKVAGTEKRPHIVDESLEVGFQKSRMYDCISNTTFRNAEIPIRVGIQDELRSLTMKEMNLIADSIIQRIDEISGSGNGPRFVGTHFSGDGLIVLCADERSRWWLVKCVENLKPYEGARLRTIFEKDSQVSAFGTVWIPGPPVETRMLLNRLDVQNEGLYCVGWKVLRRSTHVRNGQLVKLAFNNNALESLKKIQFRPIFGFGTIHIQVEGHSNNEDMQSEADPPRWNMRHQQSDCSSVKPEPLHGSWGINPMNYNWGGPMPGPWGMGPPMTDFTENSTAMNPMTCGNMNATMTMPISRPQRRRNKGSRKRGSFPRRSRTVNPMDETL